MYRVYTQIVTVVDADSFDEAQNKMLDAIVIHPEKVREIEYLGVDGMDEM
jgi:hypothetical protein